MVGVVNAWACTLCGKGSLQMTCAANIVCHAETGQRRLDIYHLHDLAFITKQGQTNVFVNCCTFLFLLLEHRSTSKSLY